jgi:hypothetical protein
MHRRAFLGTLPFLAAPIAAGAQPAAKVYRIGMLLPFSPEHPETRAALDQFRQAVRELGYVAAHHAFGYGLKGTWTLGMLSRCAAGFSPSYALVIVRVTVWPQLPTMALT